MTSFCFATKVHLASKMALFSSKVHNAIRCTNIQHTLAVDVFFLKHCVVMFIFCRHNYKNLQPLQVLLNNVTLMFNVETSFHYI